MTVATDQFRTSGGAVWLWLRLDAALAAAGAALLAPAFQFCLSVEALVEHSIKVAVSIHVGPKTGLLDILQEGGPIIALLGTGSRPLRRGELTFFVDANSTLSHSAVLSLVVPVASSLLVRSLPRILHVLLLLGCMHSSRRLVVGISSACRCLLALTEVAGVRCATTRSVTMHGHS